MGLSVLQDSVTLGQPFRIRVDVANRTEVERRLRISLPLSSSNNDAGGSRRAGSPPADRTVGSSGPFVSNEQLVDIHYGELDRRSTPFVSLQRSVSLGYCSPSGRAINYGVSVCRRLAGGACASGFIDVLPLVAGPQWIPQVVITDELRGESFEFVRPIEILVHM